MFGAVTKKLISEEFGIDRKELCVVSIMPCSAKKAEAKRFEFFQDGDADINYVLTTQEIITMIQNAGIDFANLEPEEADSPLSAYTGAGVIFGASGGVAEAALRTAYKLAEGKELENADILEARGTATLKELTVKVVGKEVRVAIINTLAEADKVCKDILAGNVKYDLIEVMACPNGCVNGGGQPISCKDLQTRVKRAEGLYEADKKLPLRRSHENKDVLAVYDKWLEKPNSHKAHDALHTHYTNRKELSYKNVQK